MKKRAKKSKKIKLTEAEMILNRYRDICLEKREEREGYRISLKEGHKRVSKIHTILMAKRFLEAVEKVIFDQRLQECFPFSQAFYHLKEMTVDKIMELEKIDRGGEEEKE